ncbi:MAG: bifunctional 4-hydroxy-2-oxoglutarate aldolase/2-dehydro-3-deoxy-phosphogluconate aldolase [Oscillospiraceae bacterium]|jgi:2-dehydro-3-deoxyphosphogluconate aldolase/(4S)-4-hydroxy-2-oxoglutarate aldolase|nr:bifunctional 4-hydroxy-2-oxoglutarate aldolase/2-dehydro-3-deoxy-phosphogluconate aldolase [Oscillospiraceae bacterium]
MNSTELFRRMSQLRIIPVVSVREEAQAVPMARALAEGGLPAAEITFRTSAAEGAISAIAREAPEVLLLAGTVLDVPTASRAVEAGAAGIVSPGTNPEVVAWCLKRGIPVLPGCATPTEAEACLRMGLSAVKLFPAEAVGGAALLKALSGPYPQLKFMPTGGISPQNLGAYLALPNVFCCGGSWLAPQSKMDAGDWAGIAALARQALDTASPEV